MKVVLDTNILLQAIAHASRLCPIWNAFLNARFELHLTTSILLEYEELLAGRTSDQVAQSIVSLIDKAASAYFIVAYFE